MIGVNRLLSTYPFNISAKLYGNTKQWYDEHQMFKQLNKYYIERASDINDLNEILRLN